jgi:hypothetical protein
MIKKSALMKGLLCLVAMCVPFGAIAGSGPSTTPYKLFTAVIVAGEPDPSRAYELVRNGVTVESGVTDAQGRVYTSRHQPGSPEDWLIRFKVPHYVEAIDANTRGALDKEYAVHIDADGKQGTALFYEPDQVVDTATNFGYECLIRPSIKCSTQRFLWLEVYGYQSHLGGAHYWILQDGKVVDSGRSGVDGMFYVRDSRSDVNGPLRLDVVFCTGSPIAIEQSAGGTMTTRAIEQEPYPAALQSAMKDACSGKTKDAVATYSYSQPYAQILQGRAFVHVGQFEARLPVALANLPASQVIRRLKIQGG